MLETAGRPHRSVKSKESIFGTRAVEQSWKRPFNDPIPLPRGGPLITLEDAGNYITRLPKAVHEAAEWQAAMEALILVMTLDSPNDVCTHRRHEGAQWSRRAHVQPRPQRIIIGGKRKLARDRC
jgi:hypothetical protein